MLRIHIGNLSDDAKETVLHDLFSQYGQVDAVTIIRDAATGQSRGFGFVEMSHNEEAQQAIVDLNGHMVDGQPLEIAETRPRAPRGSAAASFGDPVDADPNADADAGAGAGD